MTKRLALNLGCGRVHYPIDPTNQKVAHILKYLLMACSEAFSSDVEWLNVDRAVMPGIVNADLFSYPWVRKDTARPFKDASVDIIWASHLIEHIPHRATLNDFAYDDLRQAAQVDGWYAWFMEAWRILKPDGVIHIVVPYAFSASAVGDPSHCRYIIPETFSYFAPNDGNPFDYQIPYQFAAVGNAELRLGGNIEKLYEAYETVYQRCLQARLDKNENIEILEKQTLVQLDEIQNLVKHSLNSVEEFFLSMKPVK